ncbi:Protein M3 [Gaertneriomyces sp. JEL0708]|nr:Protein M3 [Gaertneriomyces sp. JEL0708]
MSVGAVLSKKGLLDAKASKAIASILLTVSYPSLLFTKVVAGIDSSNLDKLGIMTLSAAFYLIVGWILGLGVQKLNKKYLPSTFYHGSVTATALGNWGDLTLAVISGLGDTKPFSPGDSEKGIAYVAGFCCLANLIFFSVGRKKIGQDFQRPPGLGAGEVVIASRGDQGLGHSEMQMNDIQIRPNSSGSSFSEAQGVLSSASLADQQESHRKRTSRLPSSASLSIGHVDSAQVSIRKRRRRWWPHFKSDISPRIKFWVSAVCNLCNFAVVIGLIVAVTPPLRHVFNYRDPSNKPPLHKEPPLRVIYETLEFLGATAVPLGIINLGAALGRLTPRTLLPFRVTASISVSRLLIMPVIGIGISQLLTVNGVIAESDTMLRFILMFQACVPTASSTVYITQMFSPTGDSDEIASVVLMQYLFAFFTLTASMIVILILLS